MALGRHEKLCISGLDDRRSDWFIRVKYILRIKREKLPFIIYLLKRIFLTIH